MADEEAMGREARAREERTPIERLEESIVAQVVHLEDLLREHDIASGARIGRVLQQAGNFQDLELRGGVTIFGWRLPIQITLHWTLPARPKPEA